MIGISTCWWKTPSFCGDEKVDDILGLGFEGIELEYRITNAMYRQMKPLLRGRLRVLSIHNYFPVPENQRGQEGSGDYFLLSSTDEEERTLAIKYTIRTIEHAHDLQAQAVVLHLGCVEMKNPFDRFKSTYASGKIHQPEGIRLREEQRAIRCEKCQKSLDAVLFSLERLNREAEKREVSLGIENRYYFHELPNFEEIGIILKEFEGGNVRYWHDVGHAAVHENLGLLRQKDLLNRYGDSMLGIHLHDANGLDDHFAPGQGMVDYSMITPFLKPSTLQIFEVHPKVPRPDVAAGLAFLKDRVPSEIGSLQALGNKE